MARIEAVVYALVLILRPVRLVQPCGRLEIRSIRCATRAQDMLLDATTSLLQEGLKQYPGSVAMRLGRMARQLAAAGEVSTKIISGQR